MRKGFPGDIPDVTGAIVAAAGQQRAAGMKGDEPDGVVMAGEYRQFLPCVAVPQPYCMIVATTCEVQPIRAERKRPDRFRMSLKYVTAFARRYIP